jgi:peptidoglycan/xylan/chitin deacetylase (PgdA/CDA1 family)
MVNRILNRLSNLRSHRAVILMYHQVAERKSDPWQLAVNPSNFEKQLAVLKKEFNVITLTELVQHVKNASLKKNMVAITFDDGFFDNYTWAAPLLEWYKLPATFYLTSRQLHQSVYYWWDELESIIFHHEHLPSVLVLPLGKDIVRFNFKRHASLNSKASQQIREWTYGQAVSNERIDLYLKLWEKIQKLLPTEQRSAIMNLRSWAGIKNFRINDGATMQSYQLQKIGANPLFAIGAHTVNHVFLAAHDESIQHFEIRQSKLDLEKVLGKTVSGFAYPHGSYNETTKQLLRQEGFSSGVSTETSCVTRHSDAMALPRMQVKNWDLQTFSFHVKQLIQ